MSNYIQVFGNLSKWKQLPNYQLERRIDIFISIYLKELIKDSIGESIEELLIPEFPINKKLFDTNLQKNESYKVDYLTYSKNSNTVYFVELKANMNSRRTKQDQYLEKCLNLSFNEVIEGLKEIFIVTESWQKYFNLFTNLEDITLISLPKDFIKEELRNKHKRKVFANKIIIENVKMKLLYIQPVKSEFSCNDIVSIDYKSLYDILSKYTDDFSFQFKEFLKSNYDIS
jgi:hypothetical protein